jgi:hypothetical protein
MKQILFFLFTSPFFCCAQNNFILNEIFIGEISDDVITEKIYLGDSCVFSVGKGERFVCRYQHENLSEITMPDGRNGAIKSGHIKRAANQALFKITYPEKFFPFTKDPNIFGLSRFSNCNYTAVLYWQNYFKDSADFANLTFKAFNKDTAALFYLMNDLYLDVDGSGQWSFNNWKLINSYSDAELVKIIMERNRSGRKQILCGLYLPITLSPFGEENYFLDAYYSTWYPLTWELYKFETENDDADKIYEKKFKKLRKNILIRNKN